MLVQMGLMLQLLFSWKASIAMKKEQRSAIKAIYERKEVLVCLSTGYGKSLCYQTLMDHEFGLTVSASQLCLVLAVSPLIALMVDQVHSKA